MIDTPRRGPGRPPSANPRSITVRYRVTADEHAAIVKAAEAAGQTVTDYARDRALLKSSS
jgi:uncharacterized protein (DUF1778 family)